MLLKVSHFCAIIFLNTEAILTGWNYVFPLLFPIKTLPMGSNLLVHSVIRIYLMGQSAGAHIAACTLLEQAIKEASGEKTSWSVSQLKAYFGLSGW